MKNKEPGFVKINVEAVVGKDDKPSTWKQTPDQYEYWTNDAVKQKTTEELYPRDAENETEEEYRARLQRIGERAVEGVSDKHGKVFVHGHLAQGKVIRGESEFATPTHKNEKGKDVISGHMFEAYEADQKPYQSAIVSYYDEVFGDTVKKEWVLSAVNDAEKARETGEITYRVSSPKAYQEQQKLARFYAGRLIHDEKIDGKKVEQRGIFEDPAARYYLENDRLFVQHKEADFASRKRKESERVQLIDGKMFEGFFFPLVNQGFFDSKDGRRASFIATSKYDDFKHGADAAVLMPLQHRGRNGEATLSQQLICFDLTIGHGDEKVDRITKRFDEQHGLTEIEYPSTCLGTLLGEVQDVPHFVICLTREDQTELRSFRDDVASGKLPSGEARNLIDYQLYTQASHWADYWDEQKDSKKSQVFRDLEADFRQRLTNDLGQERFVEKMSYLAKKHSEATKFLSRLNLS